MRDTEQSYGDFTLDVYQSRIDDAWICEWWHRGTPSIEGKVRARRRKEAIAIAKQEIEKVKPRRLAD